MEAPTGEWVTIDPIFHMLAGIVVGIYMLGLGAYGIYKADKNNRESIICAVRGGSIRCMNSVINLGIDSDHSSNDSDNSSELSAQLAITVLRLDRRSASFDSAIDTQR